jgi:hypothetical protein
MRKWSQWMSACGLVVFGYLLGSTGFTGIMSARAQNEPADQPAAAAQPGSLSDETQKKIHNAFVAIKAAHEVLDAESKYVSATTSLNVFGILSGGLDAIGDLETGRGVDPETFAALYADQGTEEVKNKLTRDDAGRLVYNGKLVQMYSISRLKSAFAARNALSGEKGAAPGAAGKDKGEKPEKTEEKKEEKEDKKPEEKKEEKAE